MVFVSCRNTKKNNLTPFNFVIDFCHENENETNGNLRSVYRDGDVMIIGIVHDLKIFTMKYTITLNKMKQNDIEILHQIIGDLTNEVEQLKLENKQLRDKMKPIIGSWACNGTLENKLLYVVYIYILVY